MNIKLWTLALVITLASMVYQRKTGPTHPLSGRVRAGQTTIKYTLERSHGGPGDQRVFVQVPDTSVTGYLVYRRYKTADPWTKLPLQRVQNGLQARLPHQPPAGKLEYHLELLDSGRRIYIPGDENVVTRFKGAVPGKVLLLHIVFMVTAMLLSTRAGLEALFSRRDGAFHKRLVRYTFWATGFMFIGGLIFGPVVQKYAFGAWWTGFPLGTDLTDNKTLIAFVFWLGTAFFAVRKKRIRWGVVLASLVTLVIFAIPHSMHGSELDYEKMEQESGEVSFDKGTTRGEDGRAVQK